MFKASDVKDALNRVAPEAMGQVPPLKIDMYSKAAADAASGRGALDVVASVQSTPKGRGTGGPSIV